VLLGSSRAPVSGLGRPLEELQPDVAQIGPGGRPELEVRVHTLDAASPEELGSCITESHVLEDGLQDHGVLGLQNGRGVALSVLNRPAIGQFRSIKVRPNSPEGRMRELAQEGIFHLAVAPRLLASCDKTIKRFDGLPDLQRQVFRPAR